MLNLRFIKKYREFLARSGCLKKNVAVCGNDGFLWIEKESNYDIFGRITSWGST